MSRWFGMSRSMANAILFNNAGVDVNYVFDDEFSSAESAPITTPRTSEPTGELLVVDTNSIISIAGGALVIDGTAASNDGVVIGDGAGSAEIFTRADGLAIGYDLTDTTSVGTGIRFGFGSTPLTNGNIYGFDFNAGQVRVQDGVTAIASYSLASLNTDYFVCIIGTRAFLIVDNLILWVIDSVNTNLYGKVRLGASALDFAVGRMSVIDDSISTTRGNLFAFEESGALAGNEVNNSLTGDWFMQMTITTLPASGSIRWRVRNDNGTDTGYEFRVNSAGAVVFGSVVSGGSFTTLMSGGSFTNGAKLKVHCEGTTIKCMVNDATIFTYSSATFSTKTETRFLSLGTGGAVSDLICWNHPKDVNEATDVLGAML